MAKFTLPEDISVLQSVGPYTDGSYTSSSVLAVFEPQQGRDLIYYNPLHTEWPVILSSFSLSIKGTVAPDPSNHVHRYHPHYKTREWAKFNVFVNDVLVGTGESTADFTSYDFTDVSFGKEPTLSDMTEIKVQYYNDAGGYFHGCQGGNGSAYNEVDCIAIDGEWLGNYDRNLFVESITIGGVTIMTQYTQQPDDVNVFYDKAQNSGGYGASSWSGKVDVNGAMGWSGFMVFQIPTSYFTLIQGEPDDLPTFSTKISESYDDRMPLGTYTLNNRGTWEENNYNESTLQPYLTEEYEYRKSYKLETWNSTKVNTPDGDIILPAVQHAGTGTGEYDESNTGKFCVEALPFIVNPDNDDIIHLDRYYDKQINPIEYELATEGKINLKLKAKRYGRVLPENPPEGAGTWGETRGEFGVRYLRNFGMNIDIFSNRYGQGDYFDATITIGGELRPGKNDGTYLFKLNWDDGTELEHTDNPKLLENTVLFEHFYEKPGFYSITGVMYRVQDGKIKTWEKFQTNILLNPSSNYNYGLMSFNNFASIGGISKDSAFVKSLYNLVGINPLPPHDVRTDNIDILKDYNELDKIKIFDTLSKIEYQKVSPTFGTFLSPYQTPTDDQVSYIFGCTDDTSGPNPDINGEGGYLVGNYNPNANYNDGSCLYNYTLTVNRYPTIVQIDDVDEVYYMPDPMVDGTMFPGSVPVPINTDVEISLNYQIEPTLPYNITGNPAEIDYTFRGWFDASLVNQSNNYSIQGIDPLLNSETATITMDSDHDLIAIYEYDDITPPASIEGHTFKIGNHESSWWGNQPSDYRTPFGQIDISWLLPNDTTDLHHFEVERSYTDPSTGDTITENILNWSDPVNTAVIPDGHTTSNHFHWYDTDLDSTIEYSYKVYTVDDVGNRGGSVVKTSSPIVDEPPPTPIPVRVRYGFGPENTSVLFEWEALHDDDFPDWNQYDDFHYYEILRTDQNSNDQLFNPFEPPGSDQPRPLLEGIYGSPPQLQGYVDNNVELNNTYEYKIRAVDTAGNQSGFSEPLTMAIEEIGWARYKFIELNENRPRGLWLYWDGYYRQEDAYDAGNPPTPANPNAPNFLGFEIQKRSTEDWTRNGLTISADTWQSIGPFFLNDDPATPAFGGLDEIPTSLPEFPQEGAATYPTLANRTSNNLSELQAKNRQYTNLATNANYDVDGNEVLPYFSIGDNNSFYDEGYESTWGSLLIGATYHYRIRYIIAGLHSADISPIQASEWVDFEPLGDHISEDGTSILIPDFPQDITTPIITYGDDSTLQSVTPLSGLTNPYTVELDIIIGPPNGWGGAYDYDYFKIEVRLAAGSLGGNDAVYHTGEIYTTEESYVILDAPDNSQLVEGDTLTYTITNLTATEEMHQFGLRIVDTSGNESDISIEGSVYNSDLAIYPINRLYELVLEQVAHLNLVIQGGDDQGVFEEGEVVTIIATSDEGFVFDSTVGWTGDTDGISHLHHPETTIVMNASYVVSATWDIATEEVIDGCTDSTATNYDPTATNDDGTCEYASEHTIILHNSPYGGGTGPSRVRFPSYAMNSNQTWSELGNFGYPENNGWWNVGLCDEPDPPMPCDDTILPLPQSVPEGISITIEGEATGTFNEWDGWYSHPNRAPNSLLTNEQDFTFQVGQGNFENEVIHLYAKVNIGA